MQGIRVKIGYKIE